MKTMGGGELLSKYFSKTPFEATHICDATYGLPSRAYMERLFPAFKKRLEHLGLAKWEASNDCDNFAWRFWDYAQWGNYLAYKNNPDVKHPEGMSVGVVYYMSEGRVNVAYEHYKENIPEYWQHIKDGTCTPSELMLAVGDRAIPRGGGHAINCVVLDDEKLEFIEPQLYSFVNLTPTEIKSAWFIHF